MSERRNYDVALSFAGENRDYVDQVANILKDRGINVFYDNFEVVQTWGKDLGDFFSQIYAKESEYVVIFISKDYVEKPWTNHERKSALSRAIHEKREYVLPARFDDTELPGLPTTVAYIDLRRHEPAEFAEMIAEKISMGQGTERHASLPKENISALDKEHYNEQLSAALNYTEFKHVIDRPHWRLEISPIPFIAERIPNLSQIVENVEDSAVRHARSSMPCIESERATGNDWISGWKSYEYHHECWRVYQSGFFIYAARFREDLLNRDLVAQKVLESTIPAHDRIAVGGYHNVTTMLFTLTEYIAFAYTYSRRIAADPLRIGVRMMNVTNRALMDSDNNIEFTGIYKTNDSVLGKDWTVQVSEIADNGAALSFTIAQYFWERFGWFICPVDLMRTLQDHYLATLQMSQK